jgi:cell division protein FtsB
MRPRRVILAATAVLLAVLFIAPIRSYRNAQTHLHRAQVQLATAQAQQRHLAHQLQEAGTRHAVVEQARMLGYVFPGETPYVVVSP